MATVGVLLFKGGAGLARELSEVSYLSSETSYWEGSAIHTQGGAYTRQCTHKAVHKQGGVWALHESCYLGGGCGGWPPRRAQRAVR